MGVLLPAAGGAGADAGVPREAQAAAEAQRPIGKGIATRLNHPD
ncbi:hypothetical protein [Chryseobacterium sp. HSC-36S06]|nr:hypothetical protein [Chryseobacterium sp. HSC-36S06]MCP2037686.1 hypothetical protein [Chryseobacterium sp. HSC-36S06]